MTFQGTLIAVCMLATVAGGAARAQVEAPSADAAEAAVTAAEVAVAEATKQRALWTTARDALQQARAALQKGDFRAAIQAARFAREQAELGIAQMRAPRFPSKG